MNIFEQEIRDRAMADFDDITGWREELNELEERHDDEWVAYVNWFMNSDWPLAPASQVLHCVDVMLNNDDTHKAVTQIAAWRDLMDAKGPFEDDDPEMEQYPESAVELTNKFWRWFCWKAGYKPVGFAFRSAALTMACLIVQGQLPGTQAQETRDQLLEQYGFTVGPDEDAEPDEEGQRA
jgi:hypothetical protein